MKYHPTGLGVSGLTAFKSYQVTLDVWPWAIHLTLLGRWQKLPLGCLRLDYAWGTCGPCGLPEFIYPSGTYPQPSAVSLAPTGGPNCNPPQGLCLVMPSAGSPIPTILSFLLLLRRFHWFRGVLYPMAFLSSNSLLFSCLPCPYVLSFLWAAS